MSDEIEDDDSMALMDLNLDLLNLAKLTLKVQKQFSANSNKTKVIKKLQDLVDKLENSADKKNENQNSDIDTNLVSSDPSSAPILSPNFVTVASHILPDLPPVLKKESDISNLHAKIVHSAPLKCYSRKQAYVPTSKIWMKSVSRHRKIGLQRTKLPEKIELSQNKEERIPCPICGDPKYLRFMNYHMRLRHEKDYDAFKYDVATTPAIPLNDTHLQGTINGPNYSSKFQKTSNDAAITTVKELVYGALNDFRSIGKGNSTPISCTWCNQTVKKQDLEIHMRTFHQGQSFMATSSLKIPWKFQFVRCKICRKIFRFPAYNQHIRRVHQSIGCRYKCSVCLVGFDSPRACKIHMHRMNHRSNIIIKSEIPSDDYDQPYQQQQQQKQAQNQSVIEVTSYVN